MQPSLEKHIAQCRAEGLRRTKALEQLLATLLEAEKPCTLSELANSPRLIDQCDKATVFRLLQRLSEKGIVRRLGLHERAAYFVLISENHYDYLICTECGNIEPVNAPCPVHTLEKEIRQSTGYQNLHHELEFYGTCPACAN